MNIQDVMKKIEDNGLSGKVHTRDLLLGAQNPDALNKIVDAKIGYMKATTDAERGMYSAEAKTIRAANGYQLSDDGSKDITSQILSGKPTGVGAIKVGNAVSKQSRSGSDAAFSNYRSTLEAAQRKAQEDALGKMSALTGGYASSSAATAATAAGADYSQLLAEKELALAEAERTRAATEKENEYQKQLEKAKLAASLGDYSYLEKMGIDMTAQRKSEADAETASAADRAQSDYATLLSEAEFYAKYGDFSKLKALGIDTSLYEKQYAAKNATGGGSASGGGSGNGNQPVDIYAALKQNGATDFGTAYAMLLNSGYSTSAANTMAKYYAETYLQSDGGDDKGEPALNENYTGITQTMRNAVGIIQKAAPKNMFNTVYSYIKRGNISVEEGVELSLEQSNEAAYYVLLGLLENGVITKEKANSLAEKYIIEEPN